MKFFDPYKQVQTDKHPLLFEVREKLTFIVKIKQIMFYLLMTKIQNMLYRKSNKRVMKSV